MNSTSIAIAGASMPLPAPKVDISIRPATVDDIPAIDRLQKSNSRELGFFPRGQLQGYIEKHGVLIAEQTGTRDEGQGTSQMPENLHASSLVPSPSTLLGYIAYSDRYLKRDELGIIVQLCVDPAMRRSFIGAALLKAAFERSPYGCKLYCCWCAQDIAANRFWENMGFAPIAFRTGSPTKGAKKSPRIHIFWQKRIRAGDVSTPFWFPSKTDGGAMGAERLVLPIPPGTHWSDAKPVILPTAGVPEEVASGQLSVASEERKALPAPKAKKPIVKTMAEPQTTLGGIHFAPPAPPVEAKKPKEKKPTGSARAPRVKAKFSKEYLAQARELRDRWSEQQERFVALPAGKYDVGRAVKSSAQIEFVAPTKALAA